MNRNTYWNFSEFSKMTCNQITKLCRKVLCNFGDTFLFILSIHWLYYSSSASPRLFAPYLFSKINLLFFYALDRCYIHPYKLNSPTYMRLLKFQALKPTPSSQYLNILVIHLACIYHVRNTISCQLSFSCHSEGLIIIFFSIRNIRFIFTSNLFLFFPLL